MAGDDGNRANIPRTCPSGKPHNPAACSDGTIRCACCGQQLN